MIITKEIFLGVIPNQKNSLIITLISEFMLQQTQVKTVILIFQKICL